MAVDELDRAISEDEASAKRLQSFTMIRYDSADFLRAAAAANIARAIYVGR